MVPEQNRPVLHRKKYADLTIDELYAILRLRAEVFVVEQDCPYQDLDGNDRNAVHVWGTIGDETVCCLRVFLKEDGDATIGRVVTSQKVRGTGAGLKMVKEGLRIARELYPGKRCVIHSQSYATGFYEKTGFRITDTPEFPEDGIPHREMDQILLV